QRRLAGEARAAARGAPASLLLPEPRRSPTPAAAPALPRRRREGLPPAQPGPRLGQLLRGTLSAENKAAGPKAGRERRRASLSSCTSEGPGPLRGTPPSDGA